MYGELLVFPLDALSSSAACCPSEPREEWFAFYDVKENHVHTERCCGIINTLATIYCQRGEFEKYFTGQPHPSGGNEIPDGWCFICACPKCAQTNFQGCK
jgi:hypothetical protein